jgi:hypothetical protein
MAFSKAANRASTRGICTVVLVKAPSTSVARVCSLLTRRSHLLHRASRYHLLARQVEWTFARPSCEDRRQLAISVNERSRYGTYDAAAARLVRARKS